MSELYLGMISGTSMDAVDCALVDFAGPLPQVLDFHSPLLPPDLKRRLLGLCADEGLSLRALGELDVELGELFARTALELLDRKRLHVTEIRAIGSHGQTIYHQPRRAGNEVPFTLQIADPNTLAERTGIPVVADFRRRDMAAGGQGAPLVPAFHREVFHSSKRDRVILNLGGIANITLLPAKGGSTPAFDTGPANVLMDWWIGENQDLPFDEDGAWAGTGRCNEVLLKTLLDEPYFALPAPKSTGRELFNGAWLRAKLAQAKVSPPPEDIQATLLRLTVVSVAEAVEKASQGGDLVVCGGGARNGRLMAALAERLPGFAVASSEAFGLHPDSVEAVAFAWMARKTLAGEAIDMRDFTGARHPCLLGGVYAGTRGWEKGDASPFS